MSLYFIMNPGSRGGKSGKWIKEILELLDTKKIDYAYQETETLHDAYRFSVYANNKDYDTIVAVGGDGTINKVLNGFFDKAGKRLSCAKMGVIHTGTSPDFCKNYGIPTEPISALNTLLEGHSKKVSIGKIVYTKKIDPQLSGRTVDYATDYETAYFGCCVNIGLGAELARRANSGIRKRIGDIPGTFISLIQTLSSYNPSDFTAIRDGATFTIPKVYNISIGISYFVASGIKIQNNLREGENHFYNLILNNMKWSNWPKCLYSIYSGKEIEQKNFISLEYCESIDISGNIKNPEIEFDGDPQGYLPCRIQMASDKLDLLTGVL